MSRIPGCLAKAPDVPGTAFWGQEGERVPIRFEKPPDPIPEIL